MYFRDKILRRIRYERSKGAPDIPAAPGTTPIPKDHVRLYHYIGSGKGGQTPASPGEMAESLRRGGIDINKSRGHTYGSPREVWASTVPPGKHKVFAEFDIHKDDPRWATEQPRTPADVDRLNQSNVHVTFNDTIKPHEIHAVHEPWHETYRYLLDRNKIPEVLSGKHDRLLANPESKEAQAIAYIKARHGNLT